MQRTRSSASPPRSPLMRSPLGAELRICLPKSHGRSFKGELPLTRTLMIAALVLVAASSTLGQTQSAKREQGGNTEQTIRQLDHERIQAQISADAVALDRLYADDFLGVGPSGTVRTKAQVIEDFTSGKLKFQTITTDDVQVRVYGNTAVETGRSIMNGQDKGKSVPRDTRFTRVWIKQEGRWRLVANHYSTLITQK
jgi:uncharacterized protein (TIGR02246 family)